MSDEKSPDSIFRAADEFPMLDGERRCPRCKDNCCTVRAGPYDPWALIEPPSTLRPEPTGVGDEAWFCMGGCDKNGEQSNDTGPSYIARVKKTGDA